MLRKKRYRIAEIMSDYLNEGALPLSVLSKGEIGAMVSACKDQKSAIEKVGRGNIPDIEMIGLISGAIAILGNESDYGTGTYYAATDWIERAYNEKGFTHDIIRFFGQGPKNSTASIGPAQFNYGLNINSPDANPEMKDYAQTIGVTSQDSLSDRIKSVLMVMGKLAKAYNRAKKVGYSTNEESVPGAEGAKGYDFEAWKKSRAVKEYKGTGNAALDMAIMAYNTGYGKIKNYKTLYPELKTSNYLPCFGEGCISLSGPDSLVYVSQAAKKVKNVYPAVSSFYDIPLPESVPEEDDPSISQEIDPQPPVALASLSVSSQQIFGNDSKSWNQKKWNAFLSDADSLGLLDDKTKSISSLSWVKASPKLGYGKGTIHTAVKFYKDVAKGKFKATTITETYSRGSLLRRRYGRY